ncbi:MAG: class I SAM-dependent methyltransferase, partial [Candidatus Poribacteria bacterium]
MVRIATEVMGRPALQMRFDELPFVEEFDGVWAYASLLHAPKAEMPAVLARVARSLRPGGVLQLSVKYGEGEGWRDGRWFNDYTVASIHATVAAVPDLTPVRYWVGQDARRPDTQWVHAVAR